MTITHPVRFLIAVTVIMAILIALPCWMLGARDHVPNTGQSNDYTLPPGYTKSRVASVSEDGLVTLNTLYGTFQCYADGMKESQEVYCYVDNSEVQKVFTSSEELYKSVS